MTQKKILKLLSINCRYSNKDIAKAANVSADTVEYHITNLIKKKKLGLFYLYVDERMFGLSHCHYLVQVKNIEAVKLDDLAEIPNISFINTSWGRYDIQFIIQYKNKTDIEYTIKKIKNSIGSNMQQDLFLDYLDYYKWTNIFPEIDVPVARIEKKKNIVYKIDGRSYSETKISLKIKLDSTGYKILLELTNNPRASYTEIANKVKVSRETVRLRIKKFIEKELIRNLSVLHDYRAYNYFTCYVLMKVKVDDEAKLKESLGENKKAFYAAKLSGKFNIIIYLWAKTPGEFGEEIKKLKKMFVEIQDMELFFLEDIKKAKYVPMNLIEIQR